MRHSVRALALTVRRMEYALLLPVVFFLTWLEAVPQRTREDLQLSVVAAAMMVAGISGVAIIKSFYI